MSEENVEIVLRGFRLIEASEFDQWIALWDPEGRSTAPAGWPEQGPFEGREAIRRQFERLTSDWERHHFEDLAVIANEGEWVVLTFRWCTRGVASGIVTDFDMAVANRLRHGKIIEAHFRWNGAEALKAAGLSE